MTSAQLTAQIVRKEASLVKAQDALDAIMDGGAQGYTIDTSQSRQTVTKLNPTELRKLIESLENQICVLQGRLNSVPMIGRGAW